MILEPVKEEVCRHQVILYRRENGAYVLHRVMENSDHNSTFFAEVISTERIWRAAGADSGCADLDFTEGISI